MSKERLQFFAYGERPTRVIVVRTEAYIARRFGLPCRFYWLRLQWARFQDWWSKE